MAADRPLLFPSPVPITTPSSQDDVHASSSIVAASDDSSDPKSSSFPWMQHSTTNPRSVDNSNYIIPAAFKSSSQRTSVSIQSNPIRSSSTQSKGVIRYGSSGRADSIEGVSSMSRREFDDQDARFVYIGDPDKTNESFHFVQNSISTGKYSVLTFLPRNLFEQFHRVAYIYFLVIAVMNQLPQLAVFGRGVSILPLAFVLLVTAVKDAFEDWRRHRADRIENNRLSSVLVVKSNSEFGDQKWKDIRVGDIIRISADQTIPCDFVLLSTADPTGVAYVQTLNLDGESNLKTRYAKQETILSKMTSSEIIGIGGVIRCEKPNRNIYGFLANMEINGKRVSLGPSNIVLRGCQLKNTAWAIGVAVYCGGETKAMLNNSGAPSKRSRLETMMNRQIVLLSLFLSVLCTVVSICAAVWLRRHRDELDTLPYYRRRDFSKNNDPDADYNYYGWGLEIFFTFLMSVIVFQIMIPISLYISMELVRIGQAYFMIRDNRLFDEASGSRFQCRALNINEDLGQIQYVFSDKTGTLTENKMEFQCASVGGVDYSSHGRAANNVQQIDEKDHVQEVLVILRPKIKVKTDPKLLQLASNAQQSQEGKHVHDFFLALAACNTIVPLISSNHSTTIGMIDYQGESPDEQALVYAAAAYGFMLVERTSGHLIIDVQGERQRFSVLGLHEFDSERKRMSVILGCPDKTIKLFVKGADSSMFSVTNDANDFIIHSTQTHLHAYSSLGLRTLVVGMRELSPFDLEQWQHSYEEANNAILGRGRLLRKVASNVEKNVSILGASGIEDKLQEGVPAAIESLRRAGIQVWVLTGDKQETAISIGYSSKLLTRKMTQIIINCKSMGSCKKSLEDGLVLSKKLKTMSSGAASEDVDTEIALIVNGTSLVYILDSEFAGQLFELARRCSVVLCCRVAPLQKAGIVALVKRHTDEMTLAIGDGANDVSMIQMADVGIGISGQEGRQAVMASDFAIGQFRFLVPLLLVHGHWNYQRIAYMILYNFYRNAVLVFVLFWYVLFTQFSLTTAITDWSSVLYSVIYTSVPTIVVGILDKDVSRRVLLSHPQLYGAGQRGESYSPRLFWVCMADTVWQSVVIFFVPLFAYRETTVDVSSLGDVWVLGVVILANLHLAMDVMRWTWITHAAIWGSIVATFLCVIVIDAIPVLVGYWAIFEIAKKGVFWLCLLGMIVGGMLPRFAVKVFCEFWSPSDIQIAREAQKYGRNVQQLEVAQTEMNPPS